MNLEKAALKTGEKKILYICYLNSNPLTFYTVFKSPIATFAHQPNVWIKASGQILFHQPYRMPQEIGFHIHFCYCCCRCQQCCHFSNQWTVLSQRSASNWKMVSRWSLSLGRCSLHAIANGTKMCIDLTRDSNHLICTYYILETVCILCVWHI